MSRVVENAIKGVGNSQFNILNEKGSFEVRNAVIFWTNFAGEPNKWGSTARTFNLAVNAEMGKILQDAGWRVRDRKFNEGEPDEETLYYISIKLNYDSKFPPIVTLFSDFRGKRSKRVLDGETVGELDRIDIQSADCIVNAYESQAFPGKITGYLQKLNIIQEPEMEFGGKYDDWLDEEYDCLAAGTCSIEEHDIIMAEKKRMNREETEAFLEDLRRRNSIERV